MRAVKEPNVTEGNALPEPYESGQGTKSHRRKATYQNLMRATNNPKVTEVKSPTRTFYLCYNTKDIYDIESAIKLRD